MHELPLSPFDLLRNLLPPADCYDISATKHGSFAAYQACWKLHRRRCCSNTSGYAAQFLRKHRGFRALAGVSSAGLSSLQVLRPEQQNRKD